MPLIFFSEKQKLRKTWIYIILLGVIGLLLFLIFWQIFTDVSGHLTDVSVWGLILFLLIPIGALWLLHNAELTTEISETGLTYKYYPFHLTSRFISWKDIDKAFVRKYNALREFGGWGLRIGKGRAYTVAGNQGLQLILCNGKRILFGTQDPEKLDEIVRLANYKEGSG